MIYPQRPCAVCGRKWTPKHPRGLCCRIQCSMALSTLKALLRVLGPWEAHQRDEWTRVGLRALRSAWKAREASPRG